jgi:hypothetical protein
MLSKEQVQRLRKISAFILKQPKRFNIKEGLVNSYEAVGQLEQPPCGTACCYAGAGYIIGKNLRNINKLYVQWRTVQEYSQEFLGFGTDWEMRDRLFYEQNWPVFYQQAYTQSKSAKERAFVGAARIEHFIATNGDE